VRSLRTFALAAGLGLLAVAPAHGAVTIGSNLGSNANSNSCGAMDCTTTNLALSADVAPNGLTSPVTGTVTSWRFKSGSNGNTVSLRVLRPGAGVTFTGVGVSASATSAGGLNGPFTTSLPIQRGDHVGLNRTNGALVLSTDVGSTQIYWTPPLAEGQTLAGTAGMNQEVLVQAVVEPSNTLTFGTPALKKAKGTALLTVNVPNPGQLTYSGTGVKVTPIGVTTIVPGGQVQVKVRATGKKLKKLRAKGKVAVAPKFNYTPDSGQPSTQVKKLKLKLDL
jgi:hypothetical protein